MAALRHQQDENRTLAKDKQEGDKRARVLEGEVAKMQQHSEALKARIKEDNARFAEEKAAHALKIKQVNP